MSGRNYFVSAQASRKKFHWVEKKRIQLPLEIILLLIDCFLDTITCCTFLRTNKFWYNHECKAYYLYNQYDETVIENPYVFMRDMKPVYRLQRKIVNLHDYYSCQLYLNFYRIKFCSNNFTFFGFITNAPLELFDLVKITHGKYAPTIHECLRGTITKYDCCKKIYFNDPVVSQNLYLFQKAYRYDRSNLLLNINPLNHSEYIKGRAEEFKQCDIDAIHTTNQNFYIGNNTYFISCITSAPTFQSTRLTS